MKGITIAIPGTVIKIAYEEITFNRVEEEILNVLRKAGQTVIRQVVEAVDAEEFKNKPKELKSKGKKGNTKYIQTVFGIVQIMRHRFAEAGKKGSRYLADEKLGLWKRDTESPGKKKREIESAVDAGSYRKASREEDRWTGIKRSHESIRQLVIKEGVRIKEQQELEIKEQELQAYKGDASKNEEETVEKKMVYVEADGTHIKLQERRKKVNDKRSKKTKKSLEIKVGIAYSGHDERYKSGEGKQKRLKEKFVYTGLGKADDFMRKFNILCDIRHAVSKAKLLIVGGDGAKWIKNGAENYFVDSIYVLCKYHLNKAIKRALGYNKELEKKINKLIRENKIDACLKKLDSIIKRTSKNKKVKLNKLKDLRVYLAENREGINVLEKMRKHLSPEERKLLRNTGGIEGTVGKTIAFRLKGRGMSWSKPGAEGIVQVISKLKNNDWEQWWINDRYRSIEINMQEYKDLEMPTMWRENYKPEPCIQKGGFPVLDGPHQDKHWVKIIRNQRDGSVTLQ